MKKGYLYFLFSLIAGAVIIGTTLTFINANANKSNNSSEFNDNKDKISIESNSEIENLKKEIKTLQDRVSLLENDNKTIQNELEGIKVASNNKETINETTIIKEKVIDNDKIDELEGKIESTRNKISELKENQVSNNNTQEDENIILPQLIAITAVSSPGSNYFFELQNSQNAVISDLAGSLSRKLTRDEGTETLLDYTVFPEDSRKYANVKWESSDPTIASVDNNGKVTANKPGTCTIIVKTENGLEGNINFIVRDYAIYAKLVTKKGDSDHLSYLNINQSAIIEITDNAPKKDFGPFTYTSSNEDVAIVDKDGNVKAISNGECTITIKGQENLETTLNFQVQKEE